jgi:hypothetical protein
MTWRRHCAVTPCAAHPGWDSLVSDLSPLDLDDLVDLSHVIQEVIGRALTPEESSRLKSAYQNAGSAPAGATLTALRTALQHEVNKTQLHDSSSFLISSLWARSPEQLLAATRATFASVPEDALACG